MEETVNGFYERYNLTQTTVIVPWGELVRFQLRTLNFQFQGVVGRSNSTTPLIKQQAYKIEKVVDTLGAGDCFIAAALYYLNKQASLNTVLEKACLIAGRKCGKRGLLGLSLK